mmetsp:Transcript_117745/g.327952  ORF Transcript_117745/g.327952 Transcript_117745/m.327952 type:complete len:205 (-) Transcript_117745:24-638(-)
MSSRGWRVRRRRRTNPAWPRPCAGASKRSLGVCGCARRGLARRRGPTCPCSPRCAPQRLRRSEVRSRRPPPSMTRRSSGASPRGPQPLPRQSKRQATRRAPASPRFRCASGPTDRGGKALQGIVGPDAHAAMPAVQRLGSQRAHESGTRKVPRLHGSANRNEPRLLQGQHCPRGRRCSNGSGWWQCLGQPARHRQTVPWRRNLR